ncbi:MAG: hypothetical protein CMO55_28015 [Verrucomicrobiales bacterium]|nr:hypothetical protein [Verrucomicrobiales bacterium]
MQKQALKRAVEQQNGVLDSFKRLALYEYSSGDYKSSLATLDQASGQFPDDIEIEENRGVMLRLIGKLPEAVECLERVYSLDPSRANVCDALAHSYAILGNADRAIFYGRKSLERKDEVACSKGEIWELPDELPPAFSTEDCSRNVISFSLWGENPRYLKGALRNAAAAIDIYPAWTCRFYVDDSVPLKVVDQLKRLGSQIKRRDRPATFFDGLLWRFEVISDPGVARFLIRDCDSVVNVKERVATDEWLASGKWFHAMRDFYSHSELLLAGMWGGTTGVFPDLDVIRQSFHPDTAPTRTYDQLFLRECFWPTVKQSVLVHDSVFTGALGSVPFPSLGGLPPRSHVGQNEAAVRPDVPTLIPDDDGIPGAKIVVLSGIDVRAVELVGNALAKATGLVFVSDQNTEAIRDSAEELANVLQAYLGRAERSGEEASTALMESSLHVLAQEAESQSIHCVAIADFRESMDSLERLAERRGVKILGVIRDPRDTASDRRLSKSEECKEVALNWNEHVDRLSSIHRDQPGSVDIIRYEDLTPAKAAKALNRIIQFLALKPQDSTRVHLEPVDTGKPLPSEMKKVIEEATMVNMRKLKYSISN